MQASTCSRKTLNTPFFNTTNHEKNYFSYYRTVSDIGGGMPCFCPFTGSGAAHPQASDLRLDLVLSSIQHNFQDTVPDIYDGSVRY